jgi:FKBP-type peptidyl-prolyl cis-trans isomerase
MRKGGKAIVVIPYYRGYGADIQAYYNQIIIPQFSTLVYTLEITDVY